MALTQIEAAKLSNDLLQRGVVETIVKETAILNYLPFTPVTGTAVRYNREATLPDAGFYAVGDTWTEGTPTFTEHIAALKILGGDADVDNFLQSTYADTNDIEAEVIASRAKAIAHAFSTALFVGDSALDSNSFDGLQVLVPTSQTVPVAANGGALSLDSLDEMIDLVQPGKPDLLVMSKRTRRSLKSLRRASGTVLETTISAFGQQVEVYDGIPIVVDDFCPNDETQGTAGDCSSIWALKFGQGTGLMGLEHGGITVERVGELEQKDATRHRIKWYCGIALFSELGVARLSGINA